jgi:hypothetical membrane protein
VSAARRRLLRLVACLCLLAPPLSAGAVLAATLSSPAYRPLSRSLSALGEHGAPMSLAVNASFGALGVSVLALGLALDRVVAQGGRGGRAGVWEAIFASLTLAWLMLTATRLALATRR